MIIKIIDTLYYIKKFNRYDAPGIFYRNEGFIFSTLSFYDPYLKRRDLRVAAQKKIYSYFSLLTFHLYIKTIFNGRLYYSNKENCYIIITCEEEDYRHPDEELFLFPRKIRKNDFDDIISHLLSELYGPFTSFISTRFVCYCLKIN